MRAPLAAMIAASALGFTPPLPADGEPHGAGKHVPANLEPVEKAFARTGDAAKVARTVRISGGDGMPFTPPRHTVRQGEPAPFVVGNGGRAKHELVPGTMAELPQHAECRRRGLTMEHAEPYMAHLAPGQSSEIVCSSLRRASATSAAWCRDTSRPGCRRIRLVAAALEQARR